MAGGHGLGGFSCYWKEVPVLPTGKDTSETGPSRSNEQRAAGSQILPAEGRSLPHWPVSQVDGEQGHSRLLVVPYRTQTREYLFKNRPH